MWRWANHRWGMAMCCGSKKAWWWVLDCWQWRQDLAQVLTSLERPHQTNLEEIICREASLPGCECKFKKHLFWTFQGQLGKKRLWRRLQPNVERLLAEMQFWGMNRQANTAFLRSNFTQRPWLWSQLDLPPSWQREFQMAPVGEGGWAGQKISYNIFQTRQIQHLHVELVPWRLVHPPLVLVTIRPARLVLGRLGPKNV